MIGKSFPHHDFTHLLHSISSSAMNAYTWAHRLSVIEKGKPRIDAQNTVNQLTNFAEVVVRGFRCKGRVVRLIRHMLRYGAPMIALMPLINFDEFLVLAKEQSSHQQHSFSSRSGLLLQCAVIVELDFGSARCCEGVSFC